MFEFIQQMINGLSLGSIYALMALGYTMVYGIIKLINFAHGDILMIGAYIGLYCSWAGIPFLPAVAIAMVACAVLGMIIEKVAYRPLRNAPRIAILITAIGVSFLLEYIMMYFFTGTSQVYAQGFFGGGNIQLGQVTLPKDKLYVMLIAVVIMVALQFVIQKTRVGKAMRAVSSDRDAAELMGISVNRTISFTFIIGSALAAVAGVMYGAMYTANPLMGVQPGLKAFIAAVFGGIGSIPGAMLGGMLLGLIETLVVALGMSQLKDAVAFAILIIILLVRPAGILGRNVREKV